MGLMVGLVIGYVLGARTDDKEMKEIREAWKTITTSEEVRDLVAGGLAVAGDLLQRGFGAVAERVQTPDSGERSGLRRAA